MFLVCARVHWKDQRRVTAGWRRFWRTLLYLRPEGRFLCLLYLGVGFAGLLILLEFRSGSLLLTDFH